MRKPSAERLFRSHYPTAICERRVTNGREVYYLIRETRDSHMPCADGSTRAKAWQAACARKGLTEIKKEQP